MSEDVRRTDHFHFQKLSKHIREGTSRLKVSYGNCEKRAKKEK